MVFEMGVVIGGLIGGLLGVWQSRYFRLNWAVMRKLRQENLVLQLENVSLRHKKYKGADRKMHRRVPKLVEAQRRLLAFICWLNPKALAKTGFSPSTLLRWVKKYQKFSWGRLSGRGVAVAQQKRRGRPPLCEEVVGYILTIKGDNPDYAAGKIGRILRRDLRIKVDVKTIRRVLRKHGYPPRPRKKKDWIPRSPTVGTFFRNQLVTAMDFKTIFDIRAQPLFILTILNLARSRVILCWATYNPNPEWVANMLREAFPYDETPKYMILDRDSNFLPIRKKILPAMGITPLLIDYQRPDQNGVAERFNRTLQEELLDYVIPFNDRHLNRLLQEYVAYYNTARPHMFNGGESPVPSVHSAGGNTGDTAGLSSTNRRLVKIPWVGGLHHSYRWELDAA